MIEIFFISHTSIIDYSYKKYIILFNCQIKFHKYYNFILMNKSEKTYLTINIKFILYNIFITISRRRKMDRNELNLVRFGLILLIIVGSAGFVLSFVYSITQPQIIKNELAKEVESLKIIMPILKQYEKKDNYYLIYNDENKKELIGYIFITEAKGYGGAVKCNVGIDTKSLITGIFILGHKETPGLGTKIEDIRKGEIEPYYLDQYKNRLEAQINFTDIKAITGATISSKAILQCVKNAFLVFNEVNKK